MRIEPFLKELLIDAGARLKKHYGRVKTIHYKSGVVTNLVTNVDREIEDFIKARIKKQFPHDSILAEESPLENAEAARRWVIDPLDGTTNFAHALPLFSISIGVEVDKEIVAGGVFNPVTDELFLASRGKGARLNGKKIHVSKIDKLNRALLVTGFPYDIHEHPERSLPYFNGMIQAAQGVRRLGSAAIDFCYLASGKFDGFFEVQLNPWDCAAGMLILLEAGGQISDFHGNLYSIYVPEMAASNGRIHQEMIQVLQQIRKNLRKKAVV